MKLQIISVNNFSKGFLIYEIMIAFSILTLFIITNYSMISGMESLKIWSLKELESMKKSVENIDNNLIDLNVFNKEIYAENIYKYIVDSFTIFKSEINNPWGTSYCLSNLSFNKDKFTFNNKGLFLGTGNKSTDIIVKNNIIYLSTDSITQLQADFFIIDSNDFNNPILLSSLDTGPGVSSIAIAGPYAYLANTSSANQLQIVDMHNRNSPYIISELKLPLPSTSTLATRSNKVVYNNGLIYLGTGKWNGPEFNIIDVSDPKKPFIVSSMEIGTLINDILIKDNLAYLGTSDISQIRIIDISDKTNPRIINTFSSSGWELQQGRVISSYKNRYILGRTVGGINKLENHEIFVFATTSDFINNINLENSKDIPGGVYGILIRDNENYILTHFANEEFQVWDSVFTVKRFTKALGSQAVTMKCDWSNIFFATGNDKGYSILSI